MSILGKLARTAAAAATVFGLASGAAHAEKKDLTIAYVEWSDAVVATNIVKAALEDKGYTVKIVPLSGAAMWQAVASGEADGMVAAWLPATHAAYYKKLKDKVVNLGPNVTGAKIGWAVPTYVDIDSIEDIKGKADMFGGKIIGIDPGAGLMKASETAIKDYDLPVTLVEGSDATMVAALKDAYSKKQPIVVTTWTPHWMFATWDLKYLKDPKGVFGGEETVNTVVSTGLKDEAPEAYKILDNFNLSLADEQAVMVENNKPGTDPAATARAWVDANKDKVDAWSK
ncbi:glycine betaine ABC transporter substrate-binding protein [Ancylobacter mangrovi]|uniref:Glycine betaine ABC transporter substrate-binding protein n=1 Tax=Ancylobacter mangrovi TaxID=2972472 RepID=A0A9X2T4G6_9HYPH|nr:glycine betaine ABC transporter substrate-binding protein [Ancylobacter mangrovi]MCS0496026.1 glycine betaine ABC transporter substrate-binding protein [Ancylobacter mangrovi]MCS0504556.1 glycine betaine ABC transporter substrate-binding protein [Ancylobacter mangrovi]